MMFKGLLKNNQGSEIKDKFPLLDLLNSLGIGMALISPQMEILFLNKIMKGWFPNVDVSKRPLCYKTFNVPARDEICSYCPTIKALKDGNVHESVTETPARDIVVNYRILASALKDPSGEIVAAIEIVEDITKHKQLDERLTRINRCFLDFDVDPNENIKRLTALCGELLGATCSLYNRIEGGMLYTRGQWNTPSDYNPADRPEGHICYDVIRWGKDETLVVRNLPKTKYARSDPNVMRYNLQTYVGKAVKCGSDYVGSLCVVYQKDFNPTEEDEKIMGIIASAIGTEEERRRMEESLRISEEKFRRLFEGANDAILTANAETGRILDANKQAERLLGRSKEEICCMHQSQVHPPEEAKHYKELFMRHVREGHATDFEVEVINKDGVIIPVILSASTQEIGGRRVTQGIFRDISELRKMEAEKREAEALALIDPQTRLYNFQYLQRRLRSEFDIARRRVTPISLLMIDIDYFKSINETYGVESGDLILKEFAGILQRNCRGIDVITRSSGEEFTIILSDTDREGALSFAQRVYTAISRHRFGEHKTKLKVSIGVASYPEDGMKTAAGLLSSVEKAVWITKEKGGDAIYTCTRKLRERKELESSIVEAVSKKQVKEIRRKFFNLVRRNDQNIIESVYALAHTVGARDAYTEQHSEDMVYYVTEIGKKLNLSEEELEDIRHGAMLHDIGKIGISDDILLKRGKLTKVEFNKIKKHPQIGADIIRPVHFLKDAVPIILHHHERFDGYGYASRLKGDEIPLGARIIGLVDTYQALISNRPYRKAYSKKEAQKIIEEESGKHFDPLLVKVFLEILQKKKRKKRKY